MLSAQRRECRDYRFQSGHEVRRVTLGSLPEFIEIDSAVFVGDDIAERILRQVPAPFRESAEAPDHGRGQRGYVLG